MCSIISNLSACGSTNNSTRKITKLVSTLKMLPNMLRYWDPSSVRLVLKEPKPLPSPSINATKFCKADQLSKSMIVLASWLLASTLNHCTKICSCCPIINFWRLITAWRLSSWTSPRKTALDLNKLSNLSFQFMDVGWLNPADQPSSWMMVLPLSRGLLSSVTNLLRKWRKIKNKLPSFSNKTIIWSLSEPPNWLSAWSRDCNSPLPSSLDFALSLNTMRNWPKPEHIFTKTLRQNKQKPS